MKYKTITANQFFRALLFSCFIDLIIFISVDLIPAYEKNQPVKFWFSYYLFGLFFFTGVALAYRDESGNEKK